MILRNRSFERNKPTRDAKKIYIFCEGARREYYYFKYFEEIDSRINIVIYKLTSTENNSPAGLYMIACNSLIKSESNPNPPFELLSTDEVWIVFDTDVDKFNSREQQIIELRAKCQKKANWYTAQSNPCFEVWLYYHASGELPIIEFHANSCKTWKGIVEQTIPGGFNSKKHPINLPKAIENSESNFTHINGYPNKGCTEVHNLGKVIFESVKDKFVDIEEIV